MTKLLDAVAILVERRIAFHVHYTGDAGKGTVVTIEQSLTNEQLGSVVMLGGVMQTTKNIQILFPEA